MVIAIIGGGATGAVFALHLTRALRRRRGVKILVIEPADAVGRGVAYATGDPRHLLNVRVSNMSAFADRPGHLLEWLERKGQAQGVPDPTPFSFIPRAVYGTYLAELTQKLLTSGTISHARDHCIDLVERAKSVELTLASGDKMIAELVVLATGNDPKPALPGIPSVQAWGEGALTGLSSDAPVLIVGTGLTMVDMVLSLDRLGHRGLITAVSPHGSLSMPHRPIAPIPLEVDNIPFGAELSELTSWLRGLCDSVQRENSDWRSVIDALRPHTQRLWRSMLLGRRKVQNHFMTRGMIRRLALKIGLTVEKLDAHPIGQSIAILRKRSSFEGALWTAGADPCATPAMPDGHLQEARPISNPRFAALPSINLRAAAILSSATAGRFFKSARVASAARLVRLMQERVLLRAVSSSERFILSRAKRGASVFLFGSKPV